MMKVILLTDIPKVGNKYDVKEFKEGYAQNVLLSKGLACLATKAELEKLEAKKKQSAKKKEEEMESFMNLIASINNKIITIKVKANEKGHLFKAVGPHDVAQAIKEIANVDVNEKALTMDNIKEIGSYKVFIKKNDKKGECEIKVEGLK